MIRLEDLGAPTTIHLASPRHVYDSMNGRYLGWSETIPLPSEGRGFELYCLAEERLASPVLDVPKTARRGEQLTVRAQLSGARGHLVRLDAYDPDGTWLRYYRRFESADEGNATELQVDLR